MVTIPKMTFFIELISQVMVYKIFPYSEVFTSDTLTPLNSTQDSILTAYSSLLGIIKLA